jgi:integrative and conjugative element protein (TIGR02256 family)
MKFRKQRAAKSVVQPRVHKPREGSQAPTLQISIEALEIIEAESRISPRTETGGVIVGAGEVSDGVVRITGVSGPGPRALRTRISFLRDVKFCQEFLDRTAQDSAGEIDYLGEWHKHHETDPWPSVQDIRTLERIADDRAYHVAIPILLIIGKSDKRESLRAFAIDRAGNLELLSLEFRG